MAVMLPKLLGAVVGVVILASGNAGGMTLYGTGSGYLWTIDKTTGATTVIGSTPDLTGPFGEIKGLSFSPAAVPLPAAFPLFATALAGMGLLGWRRKRKAAASV